MFCVGRRRSHSSLLPSSGVMSHMSNSYRTTFTPARPLRQTFRLVSTRLSGFLALSILNSHTLALSLNRIEQPKTTASFPKMRSSIVESPFIAVHAPNHDWHFYGSNESAAQELFDPHYLFSEYEFTRSHINRRQNASHLPIVRKDVQTTILGAGYPTHMPIFPTLYRQFESGRIHCMEMGHHSKLHVQIGRYVDKGLL